jgi:hypothetical protein
VFSVDADSDPRESAKISGRVKAYNTDKPHNDLAFWDTAPFLSRVAISVFGLVAACVE